MMAIDVYVNVNRRRAATRRDAKEMACRPWPPRSIRVPRSSRPVRRRPRRAGVRGRRGARGGAGRPGRGAVGPQLRAQRAPGLADGAGGARQPRAHARQHRRCGVDVRRAAAPGPGRLLGSEGGADHAVPPARAGMGRRRHPRQLREPGHDPHAPDRAAAGPARCFPSRRPRAAAPGTTAPARRRAAPTRSAPRSCARCPASPRSARPAPPARARGARNAPAGSRTG